MKTRDRAQLKFESRVLNFFMGKAAKEGIESTVAVKGSRKATMNDATGRIVDLAAQSRLPAMYDWRMYVDAGGLMSYGASLIDKYQRAAVYVDKILKGAKPADLPVEQPSKFELILNLKTAKVLESRCPHRCSSRRMR